MSNKSKFDFFERVKIIPNNSHMIKKKKNLAFCQGTILAKGLEDNNEWGYDVGINEDEQQVWGFYEYELESLGTFIKPEDHYSGKSIKVGVTKDGKGYIKDD